MEMSNYLRSKGYKVISTSAYDKASCPFHEDSTPSFYIYPDDHGHCYSSCGFHGSLVSLIHSLEQKDWNDSYKTAREFGYDNGIYKPIHSIQRRGITEEESLLLTIAYYHYKTSLHSSLEAQDYLLSRGITNLVDLPLGYCSNSTSSYLELTHKLSLASPNWLEISKTLGLCYKDGGNRLRNRIFIAEIVDSRVIYYQARSINNSNTKYLSPPTLNKSLFGSVTLSWDTPVVITEGPLDSIPIHSLGISSLALLGDKPPDNLFDNITNKIIIATDNDTAGNLLANKLALKAIEHNINYTRLLPSFPYKDIGEWSVNHLDEIDSQISRLVYR